MRRIFANFRVMYGVITAVICLLTIAFMNVDLSYAVALYTLGLGFLVAQVLPATAMILLIFLPLVALWHRPRTRFPLAMMAVFLPPFAYAPMTLQTNAALARSVASLPSVPLRPIAAEVSSVEVQRDTLTGNIGFFSLGDDAELCDVLCEKLIYGRSVDWVRVVHGEKSAVFRLGKGAACHALNPEMPADRPCLLYGNDMGAPADLVLKHTRLADPSDQPDGDLRIVGQQRIVGTLADATVLDRTQLIYMRPMPIPVYRDILGDARDPFVLTWKKRPTVSAPMDIDGALAEMGVRLISGRPKATQPPGIIDGLTPPEPWQTTQVVGLIAMAQNHQPDGRLTDVQIRLVRGWFIRLTNAVSVGHGERLVICALNAKPVQALQPEMDRFTQRFGLSDCIA